MKSKEIKLMSSQELNEKLEDLRKNLIKLNAQVSTGTTPKSPGEVRQVKRSIAKMLTIKKLKAEVTEKG